MRELQRRVRSALEGDASGFKCFAITPGFALTNIVRPPLPARPLVWLLARSAHVGAQPIKMACVAPELAGGEYLSNCYVKPSEGLHDESNRPAAWAKLWALCEQGVAEAAERFP